MPSTDTYEIRLAKDLGEILEAQRLRYRIFYEEKKIEPPPLPIAGHDSDCFDSHCDHLIAIERKSGAVVGNYRLLRQEVAMGPGGPGFYSATEFDLSPLLSQFSRGLLEVGRLCIHPAHQKRSLILALWSGLVSYAEEYGLTHIFGCASFPGTNPDDYAAEFALLRREHFAPDHLRVRALPERYVSLMRTPSEEKPAAGQRSAIPPLLRAYLNLKAWIGDGAVIDHVMQTIDVFLLVTIAEAPEAYQAHYRGKER